MRKVFGFWPPFGNVRMPASVRPSSFAGLCVCIPSEHPSDGFILHALNNQGTQRGEQILPLVRLSLTS